jgi:hypothetical protein
VIENRSGIPLRRTTAKKVIKKCQSAEVIQLYDIIHWVNFPKKQSINDSLIIPASLVINSILSEKQSDMYSLFGKNKECYWSIHFLWGNAKVLSAVIPRQSFDWIVFIFGPFFLLYVRRHNMQNFVWQYWIYMYAHRRGPLFFWFIILGLTPANIRILQIYIEYILC